MSDQPTALVIDGDQRLLGFIADALATFEPGFRVATCADVDAADRRIAMMDPDLVVLRTDVLNGPWWPEWSSRQGIGPERVLAIGDTQGPVLAAQSLPEPIRLSSLLEAASAIISEPDQDARTVGRVQHLRTARDTP